jgi:flagellar hook-basal body complex protein FliE
MEEITFSKPVDTVAGPTAAKKQESEFKNRRFTDLFWSALDKVDDLHHKADHSVRELAAGRQKDIHQTMIAMEKAEISFKLMMKVRNKIIAAYEEIMRMSI